MIPYDVSIHAPHEGERPLSTYIYIYTIRFQSTLPTRGSDNHFLPIFIFILLVSIHAPHEGERPCAVPKIPIKLRGFNPRSPRGGATVLRCWHSAASPCFNPRSPRGGATVSLLPMARKKYAFQSTLPTRGSDILLPSKMLRRQWFQSTLPTRGSDLIDAASGSGLTGFNPRSPRGGATHPAQIKRLQF